MNILIFDKKNFGIEDVKDALTNLGHTYKVVTTDLIYERVSEEFNEIFHKEVTLDTYDVVFTFNYSVVLSNCCNSHNIKYISWIYDSPLVMLYSYTITNPCNYIFMFDSAIYNELKNGGISTVYYMPLAANTTRLDSMKVSKAIHDVFDADISFIGSMYNEKHNLFDKFSTAPDYIKGYLDGIIQAQLKVYGYNFIEELLTPGIIEELSKCAPYANSSDGIETLSYIYANYFIARRLAQLERQDLLSSIPNKYTNKIYTHNPTPSLPGFKNMGAVDYYDNMPYIFKCSKINLNISLRSIKNGIPLRCMDIMGAGGFLLSNYQSDLAEFFVPGEDFVYYDSKEDLINKCNYYLTHEEERLAIAQNGYKKVKEFHNYETSLTTIFQIAGV